MPLPRGRVSPPAMRRRFGRLFPSLWWPLNSGPEAGLGATDKLAGFHSAFTTTFPPGGAMGIAGNSMLYQYDPRVGGFCYSNTRSGAGITGCSTNLDVPGITGPMTLAAWFYLTATVNHGGGPILDKLGINDGTGNRWNALLQVQGSDFGINAPQFLFTVGGTFFVVTGPVAVVTKRWNFIVGTYDGSSTLKVYLNGSLAASTAATGTQDTNAGVPWTIGSSIGGSGTVFLPGLVWNAMIFPRALAGSDVTSLWFDPLQSFDPPSPPVLPRPPTPPPPGGSRGGLISLGKSATPFTPSNEIISNHSGQKPLLQ